MQKLTVLVDLDSTLVDLDTKWYRTWNEWTGDSLTADKVKSWDVHLYCKDQSLDVYSVLNMPGFFKHLDPIEGALDTVYKLHNDGHRIVIVTASPAKSQTAFNDKQFWVKEHLPFINQHDFIGTHAKDLIRGDVLIDDGPHNLLAWAPMNPKGYTVTIATNYNTHAHHICNLVAHDSKTPKKAWREILDGVRNYADRYNPQNVKPSNIDADGRPVV